MDFEVYDKEISNVFQLLGTDENDITKSAAFVLSRCTTFLKNLLIYLLPKDVKYSLDDVSIYCQGKQKEGITDIEIIQEGRFHIKTPKCTWVVKHPRLNP